MSCRGLVAEPQPLEEVGVLASVLLVVSVDGGGSWPAYVKRMSIQRRVGRASQTYAVTLCSGLL